MAWSQASFTGQGERLSARTAISLEGDRRGVQLLGGRNEYRNGVGLVHLGGCASAGQPGAGAGKKGTGKKGTGYFSNKVACPLFPCPLFPPAEYLALRSETAAVLRQARDTGMTPQLLSKLRGLGGDLAWAEETQLVRMTGQGTRAWIAAEMDELLQTGRVRIAGEYSPHHLNNVADNPWMACNPNNVMIVERWTEHVLMHGGNTQIPTEWPLINRSQMMVDWLMRR